MDIQQEVLIMKDYILKLEAENCYLSIENAQLRDELESMNEPKYN